VDKSTYDRISEFCACYSGGLISATEKDFIIRSFLESYYSTIGRHTSPSEETKQVIIDTLLSELSLTNFAISANQNYEQIRSNHRNDLQKSVTRKSFWMSLGASILANLIYSFILIIIFVVASEQIATWLLQLSSQ